MNQLKTFLNWAYNHDNISDKKYISFKHPAYISISGTIIYLLSTYYFVNKILGDQPNDTMNPISPYFGVFLLIYLSLMITTRYWENGTMVFYQSLWACNQCLLVVGISFIIGHAGAVRASLIVITTDQMLWYVDLISFILFRKFPIGVAKYITWPQTSKMRLLTTFHHIWFLPLGLWMTAPSSPGFTPNVFLTSVAMVITLALIGRVSVPKQIKFQDFRGRSGTMYMNINISWQLWKDVNIPILIFFYEKFPKFIMIFILSFFWNLFNSFTSGILYGIQKIYS